MNLVRTYLKTDFSSNKVISDLVTRQTKYGNLYLKWCKYTVPKWKINVFKRWHVQSSSHWIRSILQDNPNVQVLLTLPDTIKPKQWLVQSQPTHHKCKDDKIGTCCCWHETNQYLVSKQSRKQITSKQITGTLICSKSTANVLQACKRNDTNGAFRWHWIDHYLVETYAITSKY